MPILKQISNDRVFMLDAGGSGDAASCVRALDFAAVDEGLIARLFAEQE